MRLLLLLLNSDFWNRITDKSVLYRTGTGKTFALSNSIQCDTSFDPVQFCYVACQVAGTAYSNHQGIGS